MAGALLPVRSLSAWLLLALTTCCYAVLWLGRERVGTMVMDTRNVVPVFTWVIVVLAAIAAGMFLTVRLVAFRRLIVLHASISLASVFLLTYPLELLVIFAVVNVAPACLYEQYPRSLVFALLYTAALSTAVLVVYALSLLDTAVLLMMIWAITLAIAMYSRYREEGIELRKYIDQLEENVTSLTRANYLSQEYAKGIEEVSRVAERRRLTRDIHDVVGYTLTNTIMMMEAVKVMLRTEPQRVPGFVESIRTNTEGGLADIKRMLREVRDREGPRETVFWAIKRLIQVFTMSTRVQVAIEAGNVSWSDLDLHADCVYHFVQEALVNAFRHGRATRVTITMWDHGTEICVALSDNGVGTEKPPTPNIGISGMIERAESVGGRIVVSNHVGGFEIGLHIPKAVSIEADSNGG